MSAACWRLFDFNHQLVNITRTLLFCAAFFLAALSSLSAATSPDNHLQDPDFPIYPSIKPNVDFWIDIFSTYSKSQGVIHDNQNLGIVYAVVKLDASETVRGNKKNKKIKKAVTKKYKNILLKLSAKPASLSKEEKRIAVLFGPDATPSDFKTAASRIRCQTGLKKQFRDGLIRSGAVIDSFKKTFISHGLPVDLVYLPCVESSYNFKAYSKFGAAGIWQFTHGTGRQYMNINYVVDERRDPYISTDAAARLLKKNYAALGEWPLAMTAYNHGLAGMLRAQKAKGSYENIVRSYRSRSFKFASRNFYSEFLAARIVAKNSDKYFGQMKLHKPVTFQVVKTKGFLPVKDLSERLNISIQDIRSLNPSLRTPVFNGQKYIPKGFRLRLPDSVVILEIKKNLAALYLAKQKPSRFHRVQKGDTAGSIARVHSVRLQELILANSLNRRATIYIGQNLRIPVKDEVVPAKKKSLIATAKKPISPKLPVKKRAAEKKTTAALPKPPAAPVSPAPPAAPVAPVPPGPPELKEPAAPAGPSELLASNETPAKPIAEETSINLNIVTSNLTVLRTYQKKNRLIGVIQVEAEETLGHYADWLQIPTQNIRALNKFKYGRPISIDQTIKIPMGKKTVPEFEEQRYEFHKEIEEDFFESFAIQGVETYTVKNGDNIWTLCLNELEIPFWLLRKYNPGMKFNALFPKQKIKYPLISTRSPG